MTARVLWGLAICACAAAASAAPEQSRQATEAARVEAVFADRVRAYVTLQQGQEGWAALKPTTDPAQIASRKRDLAASIANARRDSRQGDIFTPDVTALFHRVILEEFRGKDGRRIRRTILEGDPAPVTVLHVNEMYPEEIPVTTTPPTLLRRLPSLPEGLAYRIVGRALVLLDIQTNLIVDFIPDAIRVR